MSLRNNISFVGNCNFDTYNRLTKDEYSKEEMEAGIYEMCSFSNVLRLKIFPNFEFGWLNNSSGFSAVLQRESVFHADLFIGEKFRVIVACEIKPPASIPRLKEEMLDFIPFSFPTESLVSPGKHDTVGSGWHPSLGKRGCSIGVYRAQEEDLENDKRYDRYYVVCHTSLPEETLLLMNEEDQRVSVENMKLYNQYNFVKNLKKNAKAPRKVDGMFGLNSLNERMREIALENARRLIVMFCEILELDLYNPITEREVNKHVGVETVSSKTDLYGPGYNYRSTNGIESRIGDAESIVAALKHWPEEIPIYGCSYIPPRKSIPSKFHHYPIGGVLLRLGEKNPSFLQELMKEKKFVFHPRPRTVEADIETDYNTYRVTNEGDIVWHSNTTSTDTASEGILVSNGIEGGYLAIKQNFMHPRKGQEFYSVVPPHTNASFTNQSDNSFPVIWPFKPDESRKISKNALETFFEVESSSKPKQLLGTQVINRDLMQNHVVTDALNAKIDHKDVLKLMPVKVLLSRSIFQAPTYEFLN